VWLEKLPFFALAGAFSALGFVAVAAESYLRPVTEMGLGFRIVLSLWGTAFYLLKTVWPTGLSPLYQLPFVVTWAHFALVGAATALALGAWRRWPAFSLAWAAYLVLLFPVAGLFHNGPQAAADRYSYLACIPWALLAGAAVAGARRYPVAARVGAAGVVAVLAGLTWQQAAVWRDGVSLWSHAVRVNPASRAAHAKLGEAYAAEGRLLEAAAHYAETLRLSSNKAPYHVIVGSLLARAGLGDGAAAHFRAALALRPGLPEACAGLQALDARGASGGALGPGCPADGQAGPSGRSTSSSR
jgi:tetratricopeptide (TPR) repeat protein